MTRKPIDDVLEHVLENGYSEPGEKVDYDFDIDLTIRQANEIDKLNREVNIWVKYGNYWRDKYFRERNRRHVYKVEMGRMRRKLSRIYDAIHIIHDNELDCPNVDKFKRI